jgi:serine/threonine-protein kinase HipA
VAAETDLARLLEAADRIENEEYVGEDLAIYFASLGSAGGARPKASVRTDDGVLWLAKFPSNSDRACNAVLEAGALELARAAGLRVPPVKVMQVGHAKVLFIRRFDRYWAEPGVVPDPDKESWVMLEGRKSLQSIEGRIGFCSALTLMGIDEHDATRDGGRRTQPCREICDRSNAAGTAANAIIKFALF